MHKCIPPADRQQLVESWDHRYELLGRDQSILQLRIIYHCVAPCVLNCTQGVFNWESSFAPGRAEATLDPGNLYNQNVGMSVSAASRCRTNFNWFRSEIFLVVTFESEAMVDRALSPAHHKCWIRHLVRGVTALRWLLVAYEIEHLATIAVRTAVRFASRANGPCLQLEMIVSRIVRQ